MALVPIPAGAREARCRSCGAPIYWVATKNGKRMPVEVTVRHDFRCEVPTHDRWGQGVSHFASCPQSRSWRTGVADAHSNPRNAR